MIIINLFELGYISVAMPGTIISVHVAINEQVRKGQALLVLEAMKMETEIQAPAEGIVKEILCHKGDKVTPEQVLIKLELKNKETIP